MIFLAPFSKLALQSSLRKVSTTSVSLVYLTPMLCAEPLKKKKKLDPQIIKQREDRRKKKLEKQIRRLEKNARQLKPIEELEAPLTLLDEKDTLRDEEIETRALLNKKWAKYKHHEKLLDFQNIDRLIQSQNRALEELRKESEELYQEAILKDITLLPVNVKGPVETPPIKNYVSPDGDYINEANKWD
ncbi:39S ribosomal protein L40, mitochondrial isoform X2 [Rhagoletis pomonella]|uniref:39S ribosomal protein L40, mitochondrial isoform X2 n=1 Tax=Rhagoletis pomonella TaxID=28610 RepID=UPI00177C3296|nr:39S ribosomal protein L40, mitochondrial isoform X2 [Rhagoletis pomonella]